jgi:hypothetical protein
VTTFALISHTSLLKASDLYLLAKAVELGARDCALAWGRAAPAVVSFDRELSPPSDVIPILFVDGGEDVGELARHYYDPLRAGAVGRVFVSQASGFKEGPYSVSESTSHEVLEALINPHLNLWVDYHDVTRPSVQVALEVCDPVQNSYTVRTGGALWPVANFVTPAWFLDYRPPNATSSSAVEAVLRETGFDHTRMVTRPREIGPGGYVVLRERGETWTEDASGRVPSFSADQIRAKSHALARNVALGVRY